jgi:hypothetical protein
MSKAIRLASSVEHINMGQYKITARVAAYLSCSKLPGSRPVPAKTSNQNTKTRKLGVD